MEFHTGKLISAPFLSALAEVKKFESYHGHYRLEVLLQHSNNQYLSKNITPNQLVQIRIHKRNSLSLTDNAEDCSFLFEDHYMRLASQSEPYSTKSGNRPVGHHRFRYARR